MRFGALVLTLILGVVGAATAQATADLIVKLRDPHAIATAAARDAAAARLSDSAGLKLQALGVSSGGELLLGIDREAIGMELLNAARTLPGIVAAEPAEGTAVVIEPGSAPGVPDLATMSRSLAEATGAPVTTRMQDGSVIVEAMPDELVDQAARRLQDLPEVSYAQPNLRLGIQPPDPPVMKPL